MDLVLGPEGAPCTLADVQKSGGIDEERLSGWYEDVRAALAVLHKAGVVHRDIKPENVLIGPDGHAVLADFGVSRVMDASLRAELSLTRTTTVDEDSGRRTLLGTMAYLAPEVRAGGEPTPVSDCWAMGVMLFRLLTGMWYWDPDAINAKLLLQPFDARWERLFARLLASDPAQRALPPFGGDHRLTLRRVGIVCAALAALALVGFVVWRFTAAPPVPDVDNLYVLPE